jgi:hypothetical protein
MALVSYLSCLSIFDFEASYGRLSYQKGSDISTDILPPRLRYQNKKSAETIALLYSMCGMTSKCYQLENKITATVSIY